MLKTLGEGIEGANKKFRKIVGVSCRILKIRAPKKPLPPSRFLILVYAG
jgi:hypothetical protein